MLLHRHYPKLSAAGLAGVDLRAILPGEIESEIMNVDAMVECSPDPGSTPGTSTIFCKAGSGSGRSIYRTEPESPNLG
jgi:hypothetical protein